MATTPGRIRPWRYLAIFAGIVVVLYALVFFTGDGKPTPKLGIDLQGGTQVTLSARTADGGQPPRDQLVQAQQIIQQRVDGLGVSGAQVVLDGTNLVITVPGDAGEQAKSLGQTAQLRIRGVVCDTSQPSQGGNTPCDIYAAAQQQAQQGGQPGAGGQPGSATPGTPPAGGTGTGGAPATGGTGTQPQGMGTSAGRIAPAAYSVPAQTPTPTPPPTGEQTPPTGAQTPPPAGDATASSPSDPTLAAEVTQARQVRQSSDPTTQLQGLATLNCADDPLRGYDLPDQPLVTCGQDGVTKYVLGPTIVEGTQIDNAQAGQNQQGLDYVVNLSFKSAGSTAWGNYTAQHIGQQAAFVLDGQVVSAPTIQSALYGVTQVSGNFNQQSAQQLAGVLRYGSLPLSFESSQAQTVSATLGLASLEAGLIAGAIGLALVFVYCLFYYRVLGVLTILSLALSGVVVYAVLVLLGRWVGLTLDLAGVAGFIVAIGITADSFVIFFERLKDEMREGRSFRAAVPRGWVRARRTILSADAVSFLASAVLYILAVGQVKGFAFTLGMSTVLDLIVVFLVTHPLVALASNSRVFSSPKLSGLGSVAAIGAQRRRAAATAGKGA
ncbi:protein translocase subunit SecD [Pseudonocardia benzenivorans]|uniref:Protein translocase subunit SecD n=2 Tax=Pseudonocardia TaxID=1847 RepID=F4D097_PSEUX|nr:protein translocase subunit SecD [Pseudonocardia dioxanivorans]AEA25753.1 protein-export membrane protein SecD [Pseudonocardia dioxanivorans CB1190]GJF04221.1 protein translocase subunit SecD [Pseudonocardia sp. D17]